MWSHSFYLEGGRRCIGAGDESVTKQLDDDYDQTIVNARQPGYEAPCEFAEAVLLKRGEDGISYKFRMQGNEEEKRLTVENINIAPAFEISFKVEAHASTSVGIIVINYAPPEFTGKQKHRKPGDPFDWGGWEPIKPN